MATLAKQFLATTFEQQMGGRIDGGRLGQLQQWTYDFVRERLLAPLPGSGEFDANQCAERFIFEVDAPVITGDLVRANAIDDKLVWETLRWPAENFWIEYPCSEDASDSLDRVGLMVGRVAMNDTIVSKHKYMIAIVASSRDNGGVRVCALTSLPDERIMPGNTYMYVHWYLDQLAKDGGMNNGQNRDCIQFIFDLGYALFLINTPRVGEMRLSTIGSPQKKKSRTRDEEHRIPLTEVRRVVLKVGIAPPRYDRSGRVGATLSESGEDRTKRLHRVIGHFRTYRKDREEPHVAFVPQHWRGDAKKGILLHERVVKK